MTLHDVAARIMHRRTSHEIIIATLLRPKMKCHVKVIASLRSLAGHFVYVKMSIILLYYLVCAAHDARVCVCSHIARRSAHKGVTHASTRARTYNDIFMNHSYSYLRLLCTPATEHS